MTERLIRTSVDWIAVFRARIRQLGLTHLEVDARAGLSEGHTGKVLCGTRKDVSWSTIEKLCHGLNLSVAIENADGHPSFADES
jgi:DNA-binding Xre family transcriptional regulator